MVLPAIHGPKEYGSVLHQLLLVQQHRRSDRFQVVNLGHLHWICPHALDLLVACFQTSLHLEEEVA